MSQEPGVHAGPGGDFFHAEAGAQGAVDGKQARGGGAANFIQAAGRIHPLGFAGTGAIGGVHADLEGLDGFEKSLLEGAAQGHGLADGFHLRAEGGIDAGEFFERPARNLDHHIIEGRLKGRHGLAGDVIGDFVQGVPCGDQGGDFGDGEAGGLGGQGRGTRDARVHLDDQDAPGFGVNAELHVRAAGFHAYGAHDATSQVTQDLVLAVGEGLGGGHGDAVAGVDAHGVEVFDGTHDNEIVSRVTHDFQFVFFPAQDRFLNPGLANG